jgi:N-acetylglutamate synthase-like GNAT family acetyltransferase
MAPVNSAKEKTTPAATEADIRITGYDAQFYDQVVALVTGIQEYELGGGVTFSEQRDLQDIPGTYLKRKGNFWLALAHDKVVGTIGLIDLGENNTGVLKKMFVEPAYRGSEKAVAQTLLLQLLQWAKMQGFRHLYLGTGPTLLAAHRFYEKNGFCEIRDGIIPDAVKATLVRVDTKRYYKAVE